VLPRIPMGNRQWLTGPCIAHTSWHPLSTPSGGRVAEEHLERLVGAGDVAATADGTLLRTV
jgi:hypothetical protein